MPQLYLAIDLGAESGRVIAGRFDGERLDLEPLHRFPNRPARVGSDGGGETLYWDALRLWNDIGDGLAKAGDLGEVAGIGADTWGVDFGLLDERGRLLSNPIHYRDARHDGYIERAATTVPKSEIYQRTGLQFLPFNTLYQLLALRDQNPRELERAHTLLWMPDLLHYWLSGERKSEYSIASTSQLLDARSRSIDSELLRRFDLPESIFAPLVSPGTTLGTLRPDVAKRLGLSADIPIIAPAGHDTASAVAAVPFSAGENAAFLSSGTWSLMGLELSEPLITPQSFELGFTNEGGAFNTIRFLKNIAGLWLVQECRRDWQSRGAEWSYAELTHLAGDAGDEGPFVEPDDARFASPDEMPAKISAFCRETNQTPPRTEGEFIRCCLDSLALKYRWTFEKLETLRGAPLDALYVVGGGVQNELLSQLAADCIGKPVISGPVEATAAGNILLQAYARGEINGATQLRDVVRESFASKRFEPRGEEKARWDEKFGRFLGFVS